MTYSINVDAKLVRIVGQGRLKDEEMKQCIQELRSDPLLEPGMNVLSDMREIDMDFSSRGIREMIEMMMATNERRTESYAAIVVAKDVSFGMGRMLQLYASDRVYPEFEIFRDLAEAMAWLDEHRR